MIGRITHALRSHAEVGDVAWVMSMRVLALAGNICCGLLTAAVLGPAGRGEQAALGVAPLVLAAASTLGLHASLIYNVRADPPRASRFFGAALIITTLMGLLAACAGYVILPTWLGRYGPLTVSHARLFLLSVPFGVVTPLLSGVLESKGRFGRASGVLYVQSLVTLVSLAILVTMHRLSPFLAAASYIVPGLAASLYLFWQAVRLLPPAFAVTVPIMQRLLSYGLRFYGVDMLGVFSGYLDQVFIVYLLSPAATGAYAVALSVSRMLTVVQASVSVVLFPSIAGREASNVIDMVARAMRISTVLNGLAATAIALTAPSLLLLAYGHRFASAIAPFMILLAEAVVSSAARTLSQSFSGTGRPSVVTAMEAAGVAFSVAAMLVLVPLYGIVGAACAALTGGFARLICVLGCFRLVLGTGLPPLVLSRADLSWVAGR